VYGQIAEGQHQIFMDGRPHPPAYAIHTFPGFSTGKYEGNILTVETTHIKRGWIRAPGVAQSDEATVREHFIRHGDRITIFSVTTDPVILTEPFAKVQVLLRYTKDPNAWLYACDDGEQILDKRMIACPLIRWEKILSCGNTPIKYTSRCWALWEDRRQRSPNSLPN
jgi:hypothetical protein